MQLSKILIYGGTFNPFHKGHFAILEQAEQLIHPDNIFIVPNNIHPDNKDLHGITNEQRLKIIQLAIQSKPQWQISDYEIKKTTISYTIETIEYFQNKFPNAKLYFLLGEDQWDNFTNWKDWQKIKSLAQLIVAKRNLNTIIHNDVLTVPGLSYEISSSSLRIKPLPYSLSSSVLDYINDNGIYGELRIKEFVKPARLGHSIRVAKLACELMQKYDPSQVHLVYCAAIYHDIAKDMDLNKQIQIAINELGLYDFVDPKILHGYVGAQQIYKNYFINNKVILNAIARHTMPYYHFDTPPTLLDKVLYVADKLEPLRNNNDMFGQDIEMYRKLAFEDIEQCFIKLHDWLQFNFNKH